MAGYGLSRMMQGAVQGMDAVESRRDRASDREYTTLQRDREATQYDQSQQQYEQSQQDRQYAIGRRDIETGRADAEFKRLEKNRLRKVGVADATRAWQMKGDLTGVEKVLNDITPDGVDFKLSLNDDGTYTMATTTGEGKTESKIIDEAALGSYMMMANDDKLVESMSAKADKAAENKFALKKISAKGEQDRLTKKTRSGDFKPGTGADGSGANGKVPDWEKQLTKESNLAFSRLSDKGFMAGFDDPSKERMAQTHKALSRGQYMLSGDGSTINSTRYASRQMSMFKAIAEQMAEQEARDQGLNDDDLKARVADIIDSLADQELKNMQAAAPSLSRETGGNGSGVDTAGPTPTPEQIQEVKDNPEFTDSFNKRFGKKWLERDSGTEKKTDESASSGLIREANAGGVIKAESKAAAPVLEKKVDKAAVAEKKRKKEQRSGVSDSTLKRIKKEKTEERRLDKGKKQAVNEQKKHLRRYRRLKSSARARTMSKRDLSLALLAAESKKEKDDITRLLKGKVK